MCGELAGTIGITGTTRAVMALAEARDQPETRVQERTEVWQKNEPMQSTKN